MRESILADDPRIACCDRNAQDLAKIHQISTIRRRTKPATVRLDHPRLCLPALELCSFNNLAVPVSDRLVPVGQHLDVLDLLLILARKVDALDRLAARAFRLDLLVARSHLASAASRVESYGTEQTCKTQKI